jgi:hypothetical protein
MNYPAASYGVSKAPIRNGPFAASCGELTRMRLKITQDIASIVVSNVNDIRTGFFLSYLFRGSVTSTKNDDISISINTSVVDCESGKKLGAVSYQSNGRDPIDLLKQLASWNVLYAYGYQHAPRPSAH